ncbi:MAG: hypothetical protein AB7V32_04670 [Candidatus Berkiella sp.]
MANGGPNKNQNDENLWYKLGYAPVHVSAKVLRFLLQVIVVLVAVLGVVALKGLNIGKDIGRGAFQALKDDVNPEESSENKKTLPKVLTSDADIPQVTIVDSDLAQFPAALLHSSSKNDQQKGEQPKSAQGASARYLLRRSSRRGANTSN